MYYNNGVCRQHEHIACGIILIQMSVGTNARGNRGGLHANFKCTCVKLIIGPSHEVEIHLRSILILARTIYVHKQCIYTIWCVYPVDTHRDNMYIIARGIAYTLTNPRSNAQAPDEGIKLPTRWNYILSKELSYLRDEARFFIWNQTLS